VKEKKLWLAYAIVTTAFWGVWGAFIEIPEKAGFPATLGYVVWSLTMVPCAIFALLKIKWKLEKDFRSAFLGLSIGILGAGGQLILFEALRLGPAYLIFPIVSLFPVVTIFLSLVFLKETTTIRQKAGIIIALLAIFFMTYQKSSANPIKGYSWMILTILVFLMWGIQAYVMKFSNNTMKSESIFFYMALSAILLSPFALLMTDFSVSINWGFKGPWLAAMIHILNSVGALMLVYALRYGKAVIVVPLTGLSPLITVIISLILYSVMPGPVLLVGLILATTSILLLSE
jgi:drug/metabolite transporter (DMT)-like permease